MKTKTKSIEDSNWSSINEVLVFFIAIGGDEITIICQVFNKY